MYKLRSALIVSGWLLATSGGAEAQSSQNANAAPYNSAVGFGVGLDKIDLLEGGSAGLTYFMGNYRFNFWDDEGGDTNVFERRRQRLRGYAEVEAGYWKDSELRPFTSDFLIGVNALAVASAVAAIGSTSALAQAKEQFFPVLSYRTGAYAPNGVPFANGFVDYLKMINARDGGINGVKITFEECETGYATDKGVECYERLKGKGASVIHPLSTGITFALTEKVPTDKIPLLTMGYGRSESADGSVFTSNGAFPSWRRLFVGVGPS